MAPVRILHVHSTFSLGGKEARAVRLMNAFGDRARHTVISAVSGAMGARAAIDPAIAVAFPDDYPPLVGKPGMKRYRALARFMRGFDLVLSYNWGAMDVVGAHRLFGGPPLIHHEDGFNQDEAQRQKPARVWFRRLMLPSAYAVVVPSATLENIARTIWKQPAYRLRRISNGIPLERYAHLVPRHEPTDSAGGQEDGEGVVIGTLAGLRPVKNLPALVDAFAASGVTGRLVVVGEGPERERIETAALEAGIANRVSLPGFESDPAKAIASFDIFALSSHSEQQPISLIEAMAGALPVVATDVGDIRDMLAPENHPYIVPAGAKAQFAAALSALAGDAALRRSIGTANRSKALQNFDESAMIVRYRTLYAEATGRRGALG